MLAKYHPLVWAFAGGCLSGAALIGFWPDDARTIPRDASDARTEEQYREPTPAAPTDDDADVADDDSNAASDDPAPAQKTAEPDGAFSTEAGHSVADLLIRLEVAYRHGLAATPPQPTIVTIPQTPPPASPAHEDPAVAVAAAAAPPPPAAAPPAVAAEAYPQPRLASRDDARPRDVYMGDVHQNTNVGTVHEGDVYVVQEVVQYVPYYPLLPSAGFVPPGYATRPMKPRNPVSFSDGPFKYPVELVH